MRTRKLSTANFIAKRPPTPRSGVYELYWTFAARRQDIFERRIAAKPAPWTDDPILNEFKFCNVYRAADRVSQYLIKSVAYDNVGDSPADRLFRIVAFRTFSKPSTWDGVIQRLGRGPTVNDLKSGKFEKALDDVKSQQEGLYTGAFILCATKAFGFDEKHRNHVALFKTMFLESDAANRIQECESLEDLVGFLESFPLMGPFMSYQIAVDLNYSDLTHFDENDYTQAGPGALRGIKKAFVDLGDYTAADVIKWMVDRQASEFARLGLEFRGLWGRPLHAIDCQGLFCELDKYCRKAVPHLVSNRTRIKMRFEPNKEGLSLFFPPKWGINHLLPRKPQLDEIGMRSLEFPGLEIEGRPRGKLQVRKSNKTKGKERV
jgi:hypothetical protein